MCPETTFLQSQATESGAQLLDPWLYHGYTHDMKTAISLPDKLYDEAERTAQKMGIPRSQLFAKALEEFIRNHSSQNITERLNAVYEKVPPYESANTSLAGLESIRNLTKNDSW